MLWVVRVLTESGIASLKVDGCHATEEDWLKEKLKKDGDPVETHEFIKKLKETGKVRLYGCWLAPLQHSMLKKMT
ncbi:MAG: hypothetical protein A3G42_01150 [Gammaproteobacteria bacterium RIFCSPLOWO2_12_FULL_47_76]|nr:MAG: hypothetical protein A3G42_01150 [Gammaproteobacteria bacterium RIFCSPLOWO2_12_FULL_47_76]